MDNGEKMKITTRIMSVMTCMSLCLMTLATPARAQVLFLWTSYAPTYVAQYTVSQWTPDQDFIISEVSVTNLNQSLRCQTNPVIQIMDATNSAQLYALTINDQTVDSGPITISTSSGHHLALKVSTPAK